VGWRTWLVEAFLLAASSWEVLGDQRAAEDALERALDGAEPDGAILWFLLHPLPELLARHGRHRTAHPGLLAEIQNLLAGVAHPGRSAEPRLFSGPLSDSEMRVLRYLPTNLTAPEIAAELSVSLNTVKTHIRSLYAKLGTHRRAETVLRARSLGLLAPTTFR
jgi:LuxR family maltose regulon positive regulatory protein